MRMIPGVTGWNLRSRQHNGGVAWHGGAASSCDGCHHELAQRARDLHFQFIRNYRPIDRKDISTLLYGLQLASTNLARTGGLANVALALSPSKPAVNANQSSLRRTSRGTKWRSA